MFDGLHLGHQAVVEAALHSAQRSGGTAALLSFHPHPSVLLAPPDKISRMMMTREMRLRRLFRMGVRHYIEQPFTRDFAALPASEFCDWLKGHLPRLTTLYVGENWRFGAGRLGDVSALVAYAAKAGLQVFSADRVHLGGEPISSSRIRTCLEQGRVDCANELLGYTYFSLGQITPGRRLGRTIGFPTLNLPWAPELAPMRGVYAVRVSSLTDFDAGHPRWHVGIANYGVKPTVASDAAPCLETHLLEACPFSEGEQIAVEWLHFVRPEQRFDSLQLLVDQINKDIIQVREYFRLQGRG